MHTYSQEQLQQNKRTTGIHSLEIPSTKPLAHRGHSVFMLQRTIGNKAVQRICSSHSGKPDAGLMRQELSDDQPESLTRSMDLIQMTDAQLDREICLLRSWLNRQTAGTEETNRMLNILTGMDGERNRRKTVNESARGGSMPSSPVPSTSMLPPLRQAGGANPVVPAAPTTTRVDTPVGAMASLEPSEATRNRLMQIITQGGPMPEGTRVIGSAIIEVEGYRGPREIRAISSAQTDDLGQGAPVAHAESPANRNFSASRSIGNASLRREFPFSHINDSEIKMFEEIARNMPANARGRISFLTMRSRQGGQIIEPIPACSSCNNATFQLAGRFSGVQVASYAAVHPTGSLDMGPASRLPAPSTATGAPGARGGAPSSANANPSRTTEGLRAEIGTPDMRGLNIGGPSARGEAVGAGITIAFMGANFVLNLINDHIQEKRVTKALADMEPGLRARRQQNPELGFLLIFHYSQFQSPAESLIQPGAVFSHIEFYTGRTPDEARLNESRTPSLRQNPGQYSRALTQQTWIPPVIAPSVRDIMTPFGSFALGGFAGGRAVLQDVEWGGLTGFDDEGTSTLSLQAGSQPRFLILRPPSVIRFFNGGAQYTVNVPVEQRGAGGGGQVPAVNLDPVMPGSSVSAACVFPADDATDALFRTASATRDNLNQLVTYPNFRKARWVRPENINVLQVL